jgi:sulfofructose kinase
MSRKTILCAGSAVLDHVYRLDAFPLPGTKNKARDFALVGGGCAANEAVAIARLGGRARIVCPLGVDAVGDEILRGLAREGVDTTTAVRVSGARSPISAILVDGSGERIIVNNRDDSLNAARLDDPDAVLAGADAVLADNRFPDLTLPVLAAARARGLPVVLDGDRPTRETELFLTRSTHVVFSAEGLRATAGRHDLVEGLRALAGSTPAWLCVTDGPNGAWWLEGGAIRHAPAFPVAAIDTLGAGDVFHGAFVLQLAEGADVAAAVRFSAAAAAIKCTRFGGRDGAPSRAEVAAFLATA